MADTWAGPQFEHLKSAGAMDTINIALIGAHGVGKTSFLQRALGRSRPPNNITTVQQFVDGADILVTFVEVDIEAFEVHPEQPIQWPKIQWPKQIGGQMAPRMDGALVLYDVTDEESIRNLPSSICMYFHGAS
jgi:GTPase SAR1 family protein